MISVLIVLAFIYACNMMFARFYLGAHSLDQILMGFILGIWTTCLAHFVFKRRINDNILKICNYGRRGGELKQYITKCILRATCLTLAWQILYLSIYFFLRNREGVIKEEWITNYFDQEKSLTDQNHCTLHDK